MIDMGEFSFTTCIGLGIPLRFGVHVLITPRRRLGARNDAGNIGILAASVERRGGTTGLGLVATNSFELLSLLASSLAGALVLSRT